MSNGTHTATSAVAPPADPNASVPYELVRERMTLDPVAFSSANVTRTPGIHLTDVLRDHERVMAGGKGKHDGSTFTSDDLEAYQLQGYLWEDAMTETLRGRVVGSDGRAIGAIDYVRLPELALKLNGSYAFALDEAFWSLPDEIRAALLLDTIIATPDGGMRLAGLIVRLIECKWTTKSANMKPESDKREWFQQVKGYLVILSAWLGRVIDTVEWHVQFPCGTRWGEPPIYERWVRRYTSQEMMQTWGLVTSHVAWRVTQAGGDPHGWRRYVSR